MTPIASLVKALEEAPEGCRGLDARIWVTTLPRKGIGLDGLGTADDYHHEYEIRDGGLVEQKRVPDDTNVAPSRFGYHGPVRPAPHYTTSLDAAMTLVPDGWDFRLDKDGKEFDVEMWDRDPLNPSCQFTGSPYKRSAPLALCIASLKARLALSSGRDDVREWE